MSFFACLPSHPSGEYIYFVAAAAVAIALR